MRLWSIHPKYLDTKGLVALWREGLLARSVLIRGYGAYYNHPQIIRFKNTENPVLYIDGYLRYVLMESLKRGYNFNSNKINNVDDTNLNKIKVTTEQIYFERDHLLKKLKLRDLEKYYMLNEEKNIELNPLFISVDGPVEHWEKMRY